MHFRSLNKHYMRMQLYWKEITFTSPAIYLCGKPHAKFYRLQDYLTIYLKILTIHTYQTILRKIYKSKVYSFPPLTWLYHYLNKLKKKGRKNNLYLIKLCISHDHSSLRWYKCCNMIKKLVLSFILNVTFPPIQIAST